MKPCRHRAYFSSTLLTNNLHSITDMMVIGSIKGSIKKMGVAYYNVIVALYNKENLQLIAARKPNHDGGYEFLGLNNELKTFIVAFDNKQQFNAVIQDNVVPK